MTSLRCPLHVLLVALLAGSLGCSSGGGGGGSTGTTTGGGAPTGAPAVPTSPTTPAVSGDGSLSGAASLSGSNQPAAARLAALVTATGSLAVQVQTLEGAPIKDATTGADGSFACDGLPVGQALRIAIKTGGATMFTFVEIPKDAKAAADVRVDPLATLIFHRILRIFRERGVNPGDLGSVDCAALAAAVRRALDGLREDLAFRLDVALEQLTEDPNANAALFERLVPRSVLEAAGDALGRAEADADIEAGPAAGLLVAVARRLLHTRAALVISMQPGPSDPLLIEWVRSLRPELRFDPARADGTRWSGTGPCLVKIPFLEPDRNGGGDEAPPFLDGPVFDDAKIGALADAMKRGKALTLPELHRTFFAAPDAGAGFVMIGFGQFGDRPAPYVYGGEARALVVPPPPPGQPPDWRAAGAVEPPFERTFGPYLGRVPSLEELRQKFFDRRIHIPGNPTGAPVAFVAAKSDLFWMTRGAQSDPIRVDLELTRHPEGAITAARVTEAVGGAFFLGLTDRTPGPEGALVFLDARTLRPVRTAGGRPLTGVRAEFADLDRGAVDLGGLHQQYTRTEEAVFGGPPVPIAGKPVPVVHDQPDGGMPLVVEGPVLASDGTWNTSATFTPPTEGAQPRFFLGFNETLFPYRPDVSAPFLIDARSGAPLPGPTGPIRIPLARIEADLGRPLHRSIARLPSCAVPNPRYDPQLDPFFDDLDGNGEHGPGEPSFPFRPFVPPDVLANFDTAQGQPGYLTDARAYHVDPVIYSLPDGRPFSPGEPPPGFRTDRSPKDNGLRLRRFRARQNGFLHRRPHFVFAQLLAAFPPSFFDGQHTITPETRLDVFQALALARVRLETPEVVPDVTVDLDPGPGEQLQRVPFLGFQFAPGAQDPRLMDRLTAGLTR